MCKQSCFYSLALSLAVSQWGHANWFFCLNLDPIMYKMYKLVKSPLSLLILGQKCHWFYILQSKIQQPKVHWYLSLGNLWKTTFVKCRPVTRFQWPPIAASNFHISYVNIWTRFFLPHHLPSVLEGAIIISNFTLII